VKPSPFTPCLNELDRLVADLRAKATNAARQNKPTMWAYYERMAERLEAHFAEAAAEARSAPGASGKRVADGGVAGVALAIVQSADERCCTLPRDAAADLWAISVYCNRILRKWTGEAIRGRSLKWLRARAGLLAREVVA
jgi:hypothetical protein